MDHEIKLQENGKGTYFNECAMMSILSSLSQHESE